VTDANDIVIGRRWRQSIRNLRGSCQPLPLEGISTGSALCASAGSFHGSAKSMGFGQRERLVYNGQGPQMAEETLIQKIRSLPPERVAEVEDFVDFLTVRDQDRNVTQAATRLSEEVFRAIWDNSDDAEYDRL
jgi:hypothetical protein